MGFLDPTVANRLERRAATRSNYNPGVTRYDLSNPEIRKAAQVQIDAGRELLLARLEGRDAGALLGMPGTKGGLYLTRDQIASLEPSESGNALVDKYTRAADSSYLASFAQSPGEPDPEPGDIEAAAKGRASTNLVLLGAGALALLLLIR